MLERLMKSAGRWSTDINRKGYHSISRYGPDRRGRKLGRVGILAQGGPRPPLPQYLQFTLSNPQVRRARIGYVFADAIVAAIDVKRPPACDSPPGQRSRRILRLRRILQRRMAERESGKVPWRSGVSTDGATPRNG